MEPLPEIPGHEIDCQVGAFGIARLFFARDKIHQREVALKVLRGEFATSLEIRARFLRAAHAMLELHSPNVAAIYQAGTSTNGLHYFTFESLRGCTLSEAIRNGVSYTLREILVMARQICAGLAVAHARGLIHRDLKPSNVFITLDFTIKLLDFDLSRPPLVTATSAAEFEFAASRNIPVNSAVADGKSFSSDRLESGQYEARENIIINATAERNSLNDRVSDTVSFKAPEQIRCEHIDGRSDLYSLGVLLDYLCRNQQIPQGVSGLIHQLCEDSPQRRPSTATEVCGRIDEFLTEFEALRPNTVERSNNESEPTNGVAATMTSDPDPESASLLCVTAVEASPQPCPAAPIFSEELQHSHNHIWNQRYWPIIAICFLLGAIMTYCYLSF